MKNEFRAYNHISNGGITFEVVDTGKHLLLAITTNQFGVMTRFTTPLLEDSSRMLRAMADTLDRLSPNGGRTQDHLSGARKYLIDAPIINLKDVPEAKYSGSSIQHPDPFDPV